VKVIVIEQFLGVIPKYLIISITKFTGGMNMKIQLLRHATCLICLNGKKILLDPVLSTAGAMAAIPNVPNTKNNPLVNLTDVVDINDLLDNLDAIMVTHTHRDHFDSAAMELLPKDIPLFCQPQDADKIEAAGFLKVIPILESFIWDNILIHRTGGQHGTGEIGTKMGHVSGYTLKAATEPTLYITGDSIWCSEVEQALQDHQPQIIICFAGGAQFHEGDPITMTKSDIFNLAQNASQAKIVAVHMEAWNHCRLTRKELNTFLTEKSMAGQVIVPENGDKLVFE
jgi:L-ascorbate metabolism protein UlaG (beta-lactamase superfamily)